MRRIPTSFGVVISSSKPRLQIRLVKDRERRAGVGRDKERIDVFRTVLFIDIPRDRRTARQYRRSEIELDDILARLDAVADDQVLAVLDDVRLCRQIDRKRPAAADLHRLAVDGDVRDRRVLFMPRDLSPVEDDLREIRRQQTGRPLTQAVRTRPPVSRSSL